MNKKHKYALIGLVGAISGIILYSLVHQSAPSETLWQIISLITLLFILGIGIYLVFLVIKTLKVYIKKNS